MYLVRVSDKCIWYMYLVHVSGKCIWCMYQVHVSGACIWFMYLVNVSGACIWCIYLVCSLLDSPYFSILEDDCQVISTQEELSICGRWLANGKPEEHFSTVLHVRSTDVGPITEALQSLQQKQLDLRKFIGKGNDGAATFAGKISRVHK